MPNWTTLFASPSDCDCQDCNSVFSPASYLVDIMQYLDNCPSNNGNGDSVLQVLLKRRPDIGNLSLTCENTNTEIPYIDLANEIMEYYILNYNRLSQGLPAPTIPPDPALARDTGAATAEALKAEPQYILLDAYKSLYLQVYPFNLPYHQPLDVIRSYMEFLGTSRAELLQVFPSYPSPPPSVTLTPIPSAAVDAEMLQLSMVEYEILTGCNFSGVNATPKPNVVDYFGGSPSIQVGAGIRASDLLQQTGLSYPDLLTVLLTKFINPGQNALNVLQNLIGQSSSINVATLYAELKANTWQSDVAFTGVLTAAGIAASDFQQWLSVNFPKFQQIITLYEADSSYDLTKTFVYSVQCLYETPPGTATAPVADPNITQTFLSRVHRFIRLWRKIGWTMHELDNMIAALGETDITPSLIHKLANARTISTFLNLPPLKLACLWGDIDTFGSNTIGSSGPSLYAQLFLVSTGNTTSGGASQPNVFAPSSLGALLTVIPLAQMSDHLPEIFAALGISADDYSAITIDANFGNATLSLANLSAVYRYKLIASALGLSISDFCLLKANFGAGAFAGPDGISGFLKAFYKCQSSGFSVRVLNYVLTGESKAIDNISLTQEIILAAIPDLQGTLSEIDNNNPNPSADPAIAAKIKQLKTQPIASSLASLTGLDVQMINALIASDLDTLIEDSADNATYPDPKIVDFVGKTILYHRAAQCILGFGLSTAEVSYLLGHSADFAGVNFLPINRDQWLRLCDYTELRKTIPANLLLPIFARAVAEATASPGALASDALISAIADANQPGWNEEYLSYLAGNRNIAPASPTTSYFQYQATDFRNEIALSRIKQAMDLAIKTKMPVNAAGLPSWTIIETDPASSVGTLHVVAEQIKDAVKGKYKDNWITIATQLNNGIRENQKQALIGYLLTLNLVAPDGGTVTDADQLYEYLLLDVEMTSAVVTSRLIQATMAVQLFADRCLLGLESEIQADSQQRPPIDSSEWEWMKHYSVSAGLKKLFVYVENYLDPSLRDDKSAFFKEFESALKKSDTTSDNVENAFRDYLHKLCAVSNIDVCGVSYESIAQTLHVFARTHAAPYSYYYRTATALAGVEGDSWTWDPWQPVQLDIKSVDDGDNSGVHLMPVIWKKRLFLFWPEFIQKAINPPNSHSLTYQGLGQSHYDDPHHAPQPYWEVRLAWSEYIDGNWTPKQLSKECLTPMLTEMSNIINELAPTKPRQYSLRPTIDQNNILWITLFIRYAGQTNWHDFTNFKTDAVPFGSFRLTDIHEKITTSGIPGWMAAEVDLDFIQQGDWIFQASSTFYEPFFQSLTEQNKLSLAGTDFLKASISHKLIFSNDLTIPNFEGITSHPFFYTDTANNRIYFATPANLARRRSIFPGVNEIAGLKNAATASLQMFKVPSFSNVAISVSSSSPRMEVASVISSSQNVDTVVASTPATPSVNNFDDGISNQYAIGLLTARGAAEYANGLTIAKPPFMGGSISPPTVSANEGLAFYTFYHPFASIFVKKLNEGGVQALLAADTTEFPNDSNYPNIDSPPTRPANDQGATFQNSYNPNFNEVRKYVSTDANRNYYLENVDFSEYGTYSCYNWELFFHAPFLIATTLSKNGKYAEARQWFHYIFNPTATESVSANPNSPFWQVLPFKKALDQEIQDYIAGLQAGYDANPTDSSNPDVNQQVDEWRADPYNAFKIARLRPIAFMKNVVMAYLDNLIHWADDLFRTYTRENINEATQLYVMAARILGPAPQYIPQRGIIHNYCYNDLKAAGLDDFGDALVELENVFPNSSGVQQANNSVPQDLLGIGKTLYFCIPPNDKLLQYWTTIGDRLFKIRHGENIDGVVVPLALYEPPIDPELLLQAKALGIDVSSIIADLDIPTPLYRFGYLLLKAKEFCNEVVLLGNALLSANEKQDAEQLYRLRQTQETDLLNMVTEVKARQVLEAQANLDNLNSTRTTFFQKLNYYLADLLGGQEVSPGSGPGLSDDLDENSSLPPETIINLTTPSIDVSLTGTDESGVKVIPKEKEEMDLNEQAEVSQLVGNAAETLAAVFHLLPDLGIMGAPLGVGGNTTLPTGQKIADALSSGARAALGYSSWRSIQAASASRMGGFIRREQDWVFQANMAAREIVQLDKQILAAQIRFQMAEHELETHKQQIQNAQEIEQFLEAKFSKQELFQWMIDKLNDAHKQGYQLAYDMARRAEKAYRFELGIQQSNFVQYGYYNDAYLGITAGEQLQLALKQMEAAYLENNIREFELVKHISLKQGNPLALLQLIETGTCSFDLKEALFDMDYPGHYLRRIKSVGITIPCVAGPYTTVNSTLRLSANSLRINTDITGGYPHKTSGGLLVADDRFVENSIPFVAIATSSAQGDSGVFELNFRDERYLPFEGAGALSSWQLELNGKFIDNGVVTDFSQFDYDTISDVVIHMRYTAREADDKDRHIFRQSVVATLPPQSVTQLFSLRHDFPSQWQTFLNQPDPNTGNQTCEVPILADQMPYFLLKTIAKISNIALYAETATQLATFQITSPASGSITNSGYAFGPDPSVGALMASNPSGQAWGDNNLGIWKILKPGQPVLSADDIKDVYCLVTYTQS